MELEPRHIAPYQPHKLKCVCHTNYNGGLDEVREINAVGESYVTYTNTCCRSVDVQFCDIKLILHPLSDYKDINSKAMNELNVDVTDQMWLSEFARGNEPLNQVDYGTIQICCQNHIDFQNLIGKELAVDINTLK